MNGKCSRFLRDRLLRRERKWRPQAPRWLIFDLWILNAATLKCKIFSAAAWCLNSKFKEHLQFQITWTWIFNWKKKKSACIVERKPLQNRKPFRFPLLVLTHAMPGPVRASRSWAALPRWDRCTLGKTDGCSCRSCEVRPHRGPWVMLRHSAAPGTT